ncbi:hypothetical protein D3C75_822990 [compost metagenome]
MGQNDDFTEQHLNGPHPVVIDVQNGIEELVPVPHSVEKPEGGHSRKRQGQHNPEQHPHIIAAVDPGGILQSVGDVLEEVFQHDQVEGADGIGNHQGPQGIGQMQRLHHEVGGNHPAAEQHGEQDSQQNHLPAPELGFGQRVRHQRGEQEVDEGAQHRNINGNQHAPEQRVRGKDIAVGGQGPLLGPQNQPALGYLCGAGEGNRHHIHKGHHADQGNQKQQGVVDDVEHPVAQGFVMDHGCSFPSFPKEAQHQ